VDLALIILLHWSRSRNLDPTMCVFFDGAYQYEFSCYSQIHNVVKIQPPHMAGRAKFVFLGEAYPYEFDCKYRN